MHLTMFESFLKACDRNPNKLAIWCDGDEVTYSQLKSLVCKYSNFLMAHGVKYREMIGVPMNNSIESVALILAASAVGAGLAPINSTLPLDAIDAAFKAVGVRHLVARKSFYKSIGDRKLDYLTGCCICLDDRIEGAFSFEDVLETSDALPDYSQINGEETLILTMTSGSTGNPKPIELTQNNKLKRIQAHIDLYNITENDRVLAATPLYHSLAERLVLMPLMIGATSVLLPRFTPLLWLNCVKDMEVTFTIAVSAQLAQIVQLLSSPFVPEISSLRTVVSSSALLEPHVRSSLIEKLQCDFHEMYGASECSTVTDIAFRESLLKQQSVGRPLPNVEIHILGEDNSVIAAGEVGEIAVKTPLLCKSYYRLPEKMEESLADGFFKTGDLGWLDQDGFLYFAGRKKEIIITGGVNVYPQDIENKINEIDKVEECAAFPYHDERLGEVVALAVKIKEGTCLTKRDIKVFCARNLADFQQPHKIFMIKEFPKNAMGKLMKGKLPETVAGMEG